MRGREGPREGGIVRAHGDDEPLQRHEERARRVRSLHRDDVDVASGRGKRERRSSAADADCVGVCSMHVTGEGHGRHVARGGGALVVVEGATRDPARGVVERVVERAGEGRRARRVPHHQRDARAEAAALVEGDDVLRQ